jgi:hypothetical protein
MSKIGVGVGEEFPVDETKPAEGGAPGSQDEDRARYRAWREEREKMRSEWREKKRAFREEIRQRWRERFGDRPYGDFDHHHHHHRIVPLAIVAGIGLIALALLPHVILLVGIALALILMAAHYGRFHHYDDYHHMPPHNDVGV